MMGCVIVGGGPAGLTAALYLSRFRLSYVLIDGGDSRASLIPCSRNFPGFPDGIAGVALLARMHAQLAQYDPKIVRGTAGKIAKEDGGLRVELDDEAIKARTVLIATGMKDKCPAFRSCAEHDKALQSGVLHYCPVCDGYEVTGRHVVVLGSGGHGLREALFLRSYASQLDLVCPKGAHDLTPGQRDQLAAASIRLIDGPVTNLRLGGDGVEFDACSEPHTAQDIYAALGCSQHSDLAANLGAVLSETGCIVTDKHQRSSIKGVYAAGDVVSGLSQIATAIGEAAIAATAIRNDLAGIET